MDTPQFMHLKIFQFHPYELPSLYFTVLHSCHTDTSSYDLEQGFRVLDKKKKSFKNQ